MVINVNAHMPGLVARVMVNEGDRVSSGQVVAIINCMKNELQVISDHDGIVKEVFAKEWDETEVGTLMISLEVE